MRTCPRGKGVDIVEKLEDYGYGVNIVEREEISDYAVVVDKYEKHADLLKKSVDVIELGDEKASFSINF